MNWTLTLVRSLYCVMRHDATPRHGTTHKRRAYAIVKAVGCGCCAYLLCLWSIIEVCEVPPRALCKCMPYKNNTTSTPDARHRLTSLHIAARFNTFAECCWRVALVVELLDFAFGRVRTQNAAQKDAMTDMSDTGIAWHTTAWMCAGMRVCDCACNR